MRQISAGNYGYDYSMPGDRNTTSYYFDVDYLQRMGGETRRKNIRTPVYQLNLSNRYALGMDSNRGTPGMPITIVGRGFSRKDRVCVGEACAETHFESHNSLRFIVPILPPDKDYRVTVEDDVGAVGAGKLRVDPATIAANPALVEMPVGGRITLALTVPMVAPEEGIALEVATDIPNAISMDEINVFPGRSSCAVTVEALEAGKGHLFLSGIGFQELIIPVHIRP
jgi:hypothetical protein